MTRTIHFLLSDIESSTRLWERDAEAMRTAVAHHDELLRAVIAAHAGSLFKHVGDGVWAMFDRADSAVTAAVRAQQTLLQAAWTTSSPLLVRIALHSVAASELDARDGDLFGPGLSRCARLVDVAHGGQVIASDAVRDAAGDLDGVSFRDLGRHRLRDLREPERIHQVLAEGLPTEFPPLRSLETFPNNLPLQRTAFIGRDEPLAALVDLVRSERLVTVTGAGGAGKTRLALAAAGELLPEFADGVWFTDLAPLRDGSLIAQQVASSIGVREQSGRPLVDALADYLRRRHVLLLWDNCEHLVDPCARLADQLLDAAPNLHLLVTSRERLELPGERAQVLPPLSVDAPAAAGPAEAVRLFLDRARAVAPDFDPPDELAAIERICRRLDGIPLALELAAARLTVLSPEELVERLDDRFSLLTGGSRTAVPQHQTLRGALDWSHDLLDERERILLRRLAVFAAPTPLRSVEQVVADDAVPVHDVLDLLGNLVAKSLVITDRSSGGSRYGMLETIREYALEQLVAAGEAARLRDAHADWLLAHAAAVRQEQAETTLVRSTAISEADVRTGIEWLAATRPQDAVELAASMANLWYVQGRLAEARQHLERALDAAGDALAPGVRARAYAGLAVLTVSQGDLDTAERYAGAIADGGGRFRSRSTALWVLGTVAWARGEVERSQQLHREGIELARALGHRNGEHLHLSAYARALTSAGALDEASDIYAQMLALPDDAIRQDERTWALDGLARVCFLRDDVRQARALAEEALALYEDIGYTEGINSALDILGLTAVAEGDLAAARRHLARGVALAQEMGHLGALAATLGACAALAAAEGDPRRAAMLLGQSAAIHDRLGAGAIGVDRSTAGRVREQLAHELGDEFEPLCARGRGLALDEVVDLAVRPP